MEMFSVEYKDINNEKWTMVVSARDEHNARKKFVERGYKYSQIVKIEKLKVTETGVEVVK